MQKRLKRSEVPIAATWHLEDLFATPSDWEHALADLPQELAGIIPFKGRISSGADVLFNCLAALEAFQIHLLRVAEYAQLKMAEDGTSPLNQAGVGRLGAVAAEAQAQLSFIQAEILDLPVAMIQQYLQEEPQLDRFQKFISDILEVKPYRLSPETEATLAALGEVLEAPGGIYQISKASDLDFDPIANAVGEELPMSFALYEDHYEISADNELRQKSYASFVATLQRYQNTYGAIYGTEVKKQVVLAKLRNYQSVEQMLLQPQQVTQEMYCNVLNVVQREIAPHMRRLAKLKQRVLGLNKMRYSDLKAPLDADYVPALSFAQGAGLVREALAVMGPEYSAVLERAINERWVDYADNVGKSTGAFCSSAYGVHPYVLVTWMSSMRSAFTLAHELGHAVHVSLAQQHQSILNMWPSMYGVEAPSTLNELLLAQHILSNTEDPRMRRWTILQSLSTYHHNFVTHLLEGELQRRIYALAEQGYPITADLLSAQQGEVLSDFWGDAVEIDEGARLTWMRQPHYYAGLYPYTYSAGLSIATAMAQMISDEGQPAVKRWMTMLKAGGSLKPDELFAIVGLDMAKPDPLYKAAAYVGSLVDELEQSF